MLSFLLVVKQKQVRPNTRFKKWLLASVWVYPSILLVLFAGLVAFKISGTSVGTYHKFLYGKNAPDSSLIAGQPKNVRADEWQDTTQLIVAQSQNDYKKFNPNLGSGRNLALQVEVPYKDWSAIFRPHSWGFFLMGLTRGFAFKWWLPMLLLMLSSYFFVLRLLPGKRVAAAAISISAGLSPFLLWWYQTSAYGAIAYGLFAMILVERILNRQRLRFVRSDKLSLGLYVAALVFVLGCFELLLYPPFQIPVALVVVAYSAGLLAQKIFGDKQKLKTLAVPLGTIVLALALTAVIGVAFIEGNKTAIHALSASLYPGKRVTTSGDLNWLYLVNGYLMPLQEQGVKLFRNLSESANFIFLLPFLILPGYILLAYEFIKKRIVDWRLLALQLIGSLFLLRAFVHFGDTAYKLLLLNRVPNSRMLIGAGLVGIIQFAYVIRKADELNWRKPIQRNLLALVTAAASLIVLGATSLYVHHRHPKEFHNKSLIIISALWFSLIVFLALARRATAASLALLGFSILSGFYVLPLYRGLGFVDNSQLITAMKHVSKPGDSWVTLDDITYENFGLLAGRKSLSGVQIYPDNNFWQQVGGTKYEGVYNREGHAMFMTSGLHQDMYKVKANLFDVRFYCSDFITKNVNFALATHPISYSCTKLVDTVTYPKQSFYLYKVD